MKAKIPDLELRELGDQDTAAEQPERMATVDGAKPDLRRTCGGGAEDLDGRPEKKTRLAS